MLSTFKSILTFSPLELSAFGNGGEVLRWEKHHICFPGLDTFRGDCMHLFILVSCILVIFSKQTGEICWEVPNYLSPSRLHAVPSWGRQLSLLSHCGVMCCGTVLFSNEAPVAAHVTRSELLCSSPGSSLFSQQS